MMYAHIGKTRVQGDLTDGLGGGNMRPLPKKTAANNHAVPPQHGEGVCMGQCGHQSDTTEMGDNVLGYMYIM